MSNYILEVNHLSISFRQSKTYKEIVKRISFKIRRGSIFCLVGESGSGKSITANAIMNLLPHAGRISSGNILLNLDNNPFDITKAKQYGKEMRTIRGRDISMIFQNPLNALNPVYTIGQQIVENLRQHQKLSKKTAYHQATIMLEKLEIPNAKERIHQYPHQFSGGMAQRVMIAIAMINNPYLLIADEPTTALDVTVQSQIMQLLRKLRDTEQKSILLITHNMALVSENADDVAVMRDGQIVEIGTCKQLFENPIHSYTKGLLNSILMVGMNKEKRLKAFDASKHSSIGSKNYMEVEPGHFVMEE